MEKVLLIINPVAGKKAARKLLCPIVEKVCENGRTITVFSTTARGQATKLVQQQGAAFDRILCCGGDGTLNEVLTGIMRLGRDIPVGYVPTGTTNDLARSLDLPFSIADCIRVAVEGKARPHDMGLFNNELYFDYVASFGAFVEASYDTPQKAKNTLGHLAYVLYGISKIPDIRAYKAKVTADGKVYEGNFVYGGISNATHIAGIITLPPEKVDLNDGSFELILVKGLSDPEAKTLRMPKEDEEGNIISSHFLFLHAKEVKITFEEEVPWTLDGEYAGAFKEVHIQVLQSAVKIAVS